MQTAKLLHVQKQIERFSSQPAELCKVLQHVVDVDSAWPHEKSDLMHWAKVLDILDAILGKVDSPDDLLVIVLKFTRLLLENCNNRHIYSSYEVCYCSSCLLEDFFGRPRIRCQKKKTARLSADV